MKIIALFLVLGAAAEARPVRISEACSDASGTLTVRGLSESTEAGLTRTYRWGGEPIQHLHAQIVPNSLHRIEIQETPQSATSLRHVHFAQRLNVDGEVREGTGLRRLAVHDVWVLCSRTHFR